VEKGAVVVCVGIELVSFFDEIGGEAGESARVAGELAQGDLTDAGIFKSEVVEEGWDGGVESDFFFDDGLGEEKAREDLTDGADFKDEILGRKVSGNEFSSWREGEAIGGDDAASGEFLREFFGCFGQGDFFGQPEGAGNEKNESSF